MFQFWSPTHIKIKEEDHTFALPECTKPINHVRSEGFVYEAQHVRERLLNGESLQGAIEHAICNEFRFFWMLRFMKQIIIKVSK